MLSAGTSDEATAFPLTTISTRRVAATVTLPPFDVPSGISDPNATFAFTVHVPGASLKDVSPGKASWTLNSRAWA